MQNLDKEMLEHLSFPDVAVEKMELFPKEKLLRIFVEGAWLDINGGTKLGKGTLLFENWESLSVRRFNPDTEKWAVIEEMPLESLKDLCEVRFLNSTLYLAGFGNELGQWMEWTIVNPKMYAAFE